MASGQQLVKIFQRSCSLLSKSLSNSTKVINCQCQVPGRKYQHGTFSVHKYLHTSSPLQNSKQKFSTASTVQLQKEADSSNRELVVSKVNDALEKPDLGRLFAVVYINGKQRKVTTEDLVVVSGYFHPTVGDKIRLEKVLLVGGQDFTLVGKPILSRQQVMVEATVIEKTLSHFHVSFNYKPRRNKLKRFNLKRENYTILLINSVDVNPVLQD